MNNLIYYKYQEKEISTPYREGYLTDFKQTNDWIAWLQKELAISQEDWQEKQFAIQFKNHTTQTKYRKLFYTNEEVKKTDWGTSDDEEFNERISWPPIYLHPLVEDTIIAPCNNCGEIYFFDNRKLHEFFQTEKEHCYDWEKGDNVCVIKCNKCGFVGGIFKKCSYRICEDHGSKKSSMWWKEAWNKLGVNPHPMVREFKSYEISF